MLCPACHQRSEDKAYVCTSCGYSLASTFKPTEQDISQNEIGVFYSGDRIVNRYEVVKNLGEGVMWMVFLMNDMCLQSRQGTLKMILPKLVKNPQARQRFEHEVGICLAGRG